MELQDRKYQNECLDASYNAYLKGINQQLVVMATGTGKAVLIGRLYRKFAALFGGRPKMLVFAHREELVKQLMKTMQDVNPDLKVGKEMAKDFADTDCDIIVSCVASIGREGATRLHRFGNFDIVVCDEAHHSIATTYLNVFEATQVLRLDSKRLLVGFTATPKRRNLNRKEKSQVKTLDEEQIIQLSSVYKKIVYTYPIRKAIKEGWLSPLKGFRVKTDTSLDDVKVTAGDFQQDELETTVNTPKRNMQVAKAWLEFMEGRKTVGFTAGIKHAQDLSDVFLKAGISAKAVWGTDAEREIKLRAHRNGEFATLFNAQLLTEGYDDWTVQAVILAAPTASSTKFTQEVGRVTRIQEGIGNLLDAIARGVVLIKKDAYVLDVVDNYKRNSLVTFPSLLGLNPEMDLQGMDIIEAAETIEGLQDKYPGVDFTNLTDLSNVKAYVESIDMFAAPYTEEVKEFSKMSWMHTQDGSYTLAIPERKELKDSKAYARFLHEKLWIKQNELEEYVLSITSTETERELASYRTLQEAFASGDDVIQRNRGDRVSLMVREASWHKNPASEAAKKYLRRLTKKKPLFLCICTETGKATDICPTCKKRMGITAGEAATALNVLHAK